MVDPRGTDKEASNWKSARRSLPLLAIPEIRKECPPPLFVMALLNKVVSSVAGTLTTTALVSPVRAVNKLAVVMK